MSDMTVRASVIKATSMTIYEIVTSYVRESVIKGIISRYESGSAAGEASWKSAGVEGASLVSEESEKTWDCGGRTLTHASPEAACTNTSSLPILKLYSPRRE